jgi:hypothetical protein
MEPAVNGTREELSTVVRALEARTETRRSIVAVGIAIANFFLCAFYERYLVGPGWSEALVTLLAIESGLLISLAMAIQLQLINPILERTHIHPVTSRSRFSFIAGTLLHHRYLLMLWGSAAFAMTLMVRPTLAGAFPVGLSFLVPGIAFVFVSAAVLVLLRRWHTSGTLALALLAIITCVTSAVTIVFPESHLLDMMMPLRWCMLSCTAALAGEYGRSLLWLLPFVLIGALAWEGGSRYA